MTDEPDLDGELLDGCHIGTDDAVTDDELPWVVLFASVDESHGRRLWGRREHRHDVDQLAEEWLELFGAEP